jgi:hypothetical protein
VVYKGTPGVLLYHDHVILAVLLAQVKLCGLEDITDEPEFLLESGDGIVPVLTSVVQQSSALSADQILCSKTMQSSLFSNPFRPTLWNMKASGCHSWGQTLLNSQCLLPGNQVLVSFKLFTATSTELTFPYQLPSRLCVQC